MTPAACRVFIASHGWARGRIAQPQAHAELEQRTAQLDRAFTVILPSTRRPAETAGGRQPVVFVGSGGLWAQSPFSRYLVAMAQVAGWVAIGTVAAALAVSALLSAPLVAATLLATGAVALTAEVVHATGTCASGKGGCGFAVAMAGITAAGGQLLRPLRALRALKPIRNQPTRYAHTPDKHTGER